MSSRFERRRSVPGEPRPPVPIRHGDGPSEDERPWQTLVRRLRQLMAAEETTPEIERDPAAKPVLRVIPGGKVDSTDEPSRPSDLTGGRWR
jgi:hypothetical protein